MTQSASTPSASPGLGAILHRIAVPLLVFCAVLLGLLSLSYILLLPQLTRVEILGEQRDTVELRAHIQQLKASVLSMEDQRSSLVTPLEDGLFSFMKSRKLSQPSFLLIKSIVYEAAKVVPEYPHAVHVTQMHYTADGSVVLTGRVEGVGPRSMTVLAQFVDALKKSASVQSVDLPRFTREQSDDGAFVSPFQFTMYVR